MTTEPWPWLFLYRKSYIEPRADFVVITNCLIIINSIKKYSFFSNLGLRPILQWESCAVVQTISLLHVFPHHTYIVPHMLYLCGSAYQYRLNQCLLFSYIFWCLFIFTIHALIFALIAIFMNFGFFSFYYGNGVFWNTTCWHNVVTIFLVSSFG